MALQMQHISCLLFAGSLLGDLLLQQGIASGHRDAQKLLVRPCFELQLCLAALLVYAATFAAVAWHSVFFQRTGFMLQHVLAYAVHVTVDRCNVHRISNPGCRRCNEGGQGQCLACCSRAGWCCVTCYGLLFAISASGTHWCWRVLCLLLQTFFGFLSLSYSSHCALRVAACTLVSQQFRTQVMTGITS
jgi:hypothetical protein